MVGKDFHSGKTLSQIMLKDRKDGSTGPRLELCKPQPMVTMLHTHHVLMPLNWFCSTDSGWIGPSLDVGLTYKFKERSSGALTRAPGAVSLNLLV